MLQSLFELSYGVLVFSAGEGQLSQAEVGRATAWVELESLLKPSAGFHSATLLHQYISQVDGHGEKLRSKFSGMPVVERCL